jgi:hypothetical protein
VQFLTTLTNGTLLEPDILGELGAGDPSGCSGPLVHIGSGAGNGVNQTSSTPSTAAGSPCSSSTARTPGETGYARAAAAANSLYCAV